MPRFSSAELPTGERTAGYQAALCAYLGGEAQTHVHVRAPRPDCFEASIAPFCMGQIRGGIHKSNASHSLYVGPQPQSAGDVDFYLLINGEISFDDGDGRTLKLKSGEMAFLPTEAELSSTSRAMEMVALTLPQSILKGGAAKGRFAFGQPLSGMTAFGACLGSLLTMAAQRHLEFSVEEGRLLQTSTLDTLIEINSLALDDLRDAHPCRDEDLRMLQRRALASLSCAEFSARHLAQEAGLSVRTLHRIFHAAGLTFNGWLREERLDRCWSELIDPALERRSVANIAFRWGFNDLTTFNRNFRDRFGITPSNARAERRT